MKVLIQEAKPDDPLFHQVARIAFSQRGYFVVEEEIGFEQINNAKTDDDEGVPNQSGE